MKFKIFDTHINYLYYYQNQKAIRMSLTNLHFQNVDGNLVVAGSLSMESGNTAAKLDLTVQDTSKVYIFASNVLYQDLQRIVETFPVNAREVEICDQDGKQVTIMHGTRRKNRCGTIQITINPKQLATHITIPESKIDPSAVYYVDMMNYQQFYGLVSNSLKKTLIQNDLFKFATNYDSISINMLVSSVVHDFIEKNFTHEQIPENLNIIKSCSTSELRSNSASMVCEEIFGRVLSEVSTVSQGELFFRTVSGILTPKFVSGNSSQIKFDLRSNSIHFTGSGTTDFVSVFGVSSRVDSIRITTEDESNVVYENTCQDNYDFTETQLPKLIDFVTTYQQFMDSQSSRTRLRTFMTEKSDDIQDVVFDSSVYDEESGKDSFDKIIISSIMNFKRLFKMKYAEIITKDYSVPVAAKKRQLENHHVGWNGFGNTYHPDMLGYPTMQDGLRHLPHAMSAVSSSMTSMNTDA